MFAQRYCEDGEIMKDKLYAASSQFNEPAINCCACGKSITEEESKPAVPFNPLVTYNKCKALEADADNTHIIEYCEAIGTDYLTCNIDNWRYCSQKCGKGHETITINLPTTSSRLEKPIKAGTGVQTFDLSSTFNQIVEILPKGTECGVGGFAVSGASTSGRRLQASGFSIDSAAQTMTIDTSNIGTDITGSLSIATLGDVSTDPIDFAISICASPILSINVQSI
jgi:hypothetical protein